MKKVFILGSTGSIGVNSLKVINEFKDTFLVTGLTANSNIELLEKQIHEFSPAVVVVRNTEAAVELRRKIKNKCTVLEGSSGLVEATRETDYDILLSALVGFAGLSPTIEGIKRKKRVALANKETLVVAGEIIKNLCREYGAELIPVDSEHSAIFQCLVGEDKANIEKIILTASGGPFFNKNKKELEFVGVEDALNHPNWNMGNKISIDSATMMNKGLEVIEAHWLFNLGKEKIEVVIHPQSVVHSFVEFNDGSIKAQLSLPDMKLPIQYALTYPDRFPGNYVDTKFSKIRELTFFEPDLETFECLKLAYDVMKTGGLSACILNAANEVAVNKFLQKEIRFLDIPELIKYTLEKIENHGKLDIETLFECDSKTRRFAEGYKK